MATSHENINRLVAKAALCFIKQMRSAYSPLPVLTILSFQSIGGHWGPPLRYLFFANRISDAIVCHAKNSFTSCRLIFIGKWIQTEPIIIFKLYYVNIFVFIFHILPIHIQAKNGRATNKPHP